MENQVKKVYYSSACLVLFAQLLKLFNIIPYVEAGSICAIVLTLVFSIRLWLFAHKKQHRITYWLFIAYMIVLESLLGLDRILPESSYNMLIIITLAVSTFVIFCLDLSFIRQRMDNNEFVMKNACTILNITLLLQLAKYMFSIHQ